MTVYRHTASSRLARVKVMQTLRRWLTSAIAIVRQYRRAYVTINVAYYGIVVIAMVFVSFYPGIQEALLQAVTLSFAEEPMAGVAEAYIEGHVLRAVSLTFLFNFFMGTLLVLFAPSMLIPFAGLFVGGVRALLWGLLLAPTTPELQTTMIPHSGTLLLEGQGYILALLAVWVLGRAYTSPASVGAPSWTAAYLCGLKRAASLLGLAALVLILAAIYEAVTLIYLVPGLLP